MHAANYQSIVINHDEQTISIEKLLQMNQSESIGWFGLQSMVPHQGKAGQENIFVFILIFKVSPRPGLYSPKGRCPH